MTDSPRPAQVEHRVFEEAFQERQELRERFPMLPTGILGNELFVRHQSILGATPSFDEIWQMVDALMPHDEIFSSEDITSIPFDAAHKINSLFWFAEIACLIRCVGKGKYVTLAKEVDDSDSESFCFPANLRRHAPNVIAQICEQFEDNSDEQDDDEDELDDSDICWQRPSTVQFMTSDDHI